MKLLILSDTHGNADMVTQMLGIADGMDLVIHLGDDYRDALPLMDANIATIRVPGTWGREYQDPMIENRRFEDFLGWRFFLTHTPTVDPHDLPDDLNPATVIQDQWCDVVCHGHTHAPKLMMDGDVLICNPGHLTAPFDRGYAASYAMVKVSHTDCEFTIHDFQTAKVIQQMRRRK